MTIAARFSDVYWDVISVLLIFSNSPFAVISILLKENQRLQRPFKDVKKVR